MTAGSELVIAKPAQGALFFGVHGDNAGDSTYTLSMQVSSSSATMLAPGIPQAGAINAGAYEYYTFAVPMAPAVVYFTITSMSGDADLYVSTTNPKPSFSDSTWKAFSIGSVAVTIRSDKDPNFKVGTYYLAVHSLQASMFLITAAVDLNGIPMKTYLSDGQAQAGLVDEKAYRYFAFTTPAGASDGALTTLTVSVTGQYGDPDLVMKLDDGTGLASSLPTNTIYDYSANPFGVTATITVLRACTGCTYNIGVYGFAAPT